MTSVLAYKILKVLDWLSRVVEDETLPALGRVIGMSPR
jgi:hypothetical protein